MSFRNFKRLVWNSWAEGEWCTLQYWSGGQLSFWKLFANNFLHKQSRNLAILDPWHGKFANKFFRFGQWKYSNFSIKRPRYWDNRPPKKNISHWRGLWPLLKREIIWLCFVPNTCDTHLVISKPNIFDTVSSKVHKSLVHVNSRLVVVHVVTVSHTKHTEIQAFQIVRWEVFTRELFTEILAICWKFTLKNHTRDKKLSMWNISWSHWKIYR